jgi:hypothetical protein
MVVRENGSKYVGNFENGLPGGSGLMTLSDGTVLSGQWTQGHLNGTGEMRTPDGAKYCGDFVNDLPNGQGTFILPNGIQYSGEIKDGRFHGLGTLTFTDGRQKKGRFEHGILIEEEKKPKSH